MAARTTTPTSITLVVGIPSAYALIDEGITLPDDCKTVVRATFIGRKPQDLSDDDWTVRRDGIRTTDSARQRALCESIYRALVAGVDVTIVNTHGALLHGDGLYSQVADPDEVQDFITRATKRGANIVNVEARDSARVATVVAATAQDTREAPDFVG